MNAPNLQTYYQAAILNSMILLHGHNLPPQWVTIETDAVKPHALMALIWAPKQSKLQRTTLLPTTKATLRVWEKNKHICCSQTPHSRAMPLSAIPSIIPNFNHKIWERYGIHYIHQLYQENRLLTFSEVQNLHGLPTAAHLSHRQLHSWVTKHQSEVKSTPNEPPLTCFEKTILKLIPTQKTFSMLYTNILQHDTKFRYPFVIAWEKDLGQTLPEAMWRKIFITPKTLTLSANHTELSRKILYRWYLVPTRLKQMYPEASDQCWRCASTAGSMIHIWWTCPTLQPYWSALTNLIQASTAPAYRKPQTAYYSTTTHQNSLKQSDT
ncbi:Hypothetical predicted protein [Pelobates cultripes]|uniref:Reverse transcriptase zinc-binding domain-containing protein n=1 Tax=Pelobates cultripes TaxID=61616 RepID=A0AAD1RQV2_PELCU|nr:Hypothetical predicted protein [Pelobates cultripes]